MHQRSVIRVTLFFMSVAALNLFILARFALIQDEGEIDIKDNVSYPATMIVVWVVILGLADGR